MIDRPDGFGNLKNAHFIGVGGIGMSGLAELFLQRGIQVTGSDLQTSELITRLESLGARVSVGHSPQNLGRAELVVYSAAVASNNPEMIAAHERGILTVSRADVLGGLARGSEAIAIAGAHGKTTTTAMVGAVLEAAGLDPTIVIGGVLPATQSNVRIGGSQWMVVEADEYDRSFLTMAPSLAVLTSIDADHMEYYGSLGAIEEAFLTFLHLVPFDHPLITCADDPGVRRISHQLRRRQVTYGFANDADIRGVDVVLDGLSASATVCVNGRSQGILRLNRPGRYHIQNALAALAVASTLELSVEIAIEALGVFAGVKRRFEFIGERAGVQVFDDYAHHPNEIRATLSVVPLLKGKRLIVVFQPHLYTRTRDFADEFGRAFADAPFYRAIVTDVYPSREQPIPGVTGELIVKAAQTHGASHVDYVPDKRHVAETIRRDLRPGDMVLTMGAGDIDKVGGQLLEVLGDEGAA